MTPKAISDVNRSERIERELRRIANYKGVGDIALSAADELARLRVDAERMDFLEGLVHDTHGHFFYGTGKRIEFGWEGASSLRNAIDAATAPKQVADSSGRAEEEK